MRWVFIVMLFVLVPTSVAAQTPQATPQATPAVIDCGWIDSYMAFYRDAIPERSAEEWHVIDKWREGGVNYETARPSEARILSEFFDEFASSLERIPESLLPAEVVDYHNARVRQYSMFSAGYNAVANGDMFAVMFYTEQEEDVRAAVRDAHDVIEQACGERWSSHWE